MTKEDIKYKRRILGLTAAELGDRVGCSRQHINNMEAGRSPITKAMRVVIELEFGKRFNELSYEELVNFTLYGKDKGSK